MDEWMRVGNQIYNQYGPAIDALRKGPGWFERLAGRLGWNDLYKHNPDPLTATAATSAGGAGIGAGLGYALEDVLPSEWGGSHLPLRGAALGAGLGAIPGLATVGGSLLIGQNPGSGAHLKAKNVLPLERLLRTVANPGTFTRDLLHTAHKQVGFGWKNIKQDIVDDLYKNNPGIYNQVKGVQKGIEQDPKVSPWLKNNFPKLPNADSLLVKARYGEREAARQKKGAFDMYNWGGGTPISGESLMRMSLADAPNALNRYQQSAIGNIFNAAQQMSPSPFVTPSDFGRLAAGFGSGYLGGVLAGKALGALTGMPMNVQKQLTNAGIATGVIKATLPFFR
jgi:hypothetical protein